MAYIASYADLITTIGADAEAGARQYITSGFSAGRKVTFSSLEYIASYRDLIDAFGTNADAGAEHFVRFGFNEGRKITFNALAYIASYNDLIDTIGANAELGARSYIQSGLAQGRKATFDGLAYIASYLDLITAFGANATEGAKHYIQYGRTEGRKATFDGLAYIASYGDLIAALGADSDAGAKHYMFNGRFEGRTTAFNVDLYLSLNPDLQAAFGADKAAATRHFIQFGFSEGRLQALLKTQVDALNASINALKGALGIGDLSTLKALSDAVKLLQTEVAGTLNSGEIQTRIDAAKSDVLSQLNAAVATLNGKIAGLKIADIGGLVDALKAITDAADALKLLVGDTSVSSQIKTAVDAAAEAAQAALDAAIAAVNARIDGLKITDIAGLRDELDGIKSAADALKALVGDVKVETQIKTAVDAAAEAAQAALDAAIAAVNARIDGLKITDIAGLRDELDGIKSAADALKALVGDVKVETQIKTAVDAAAEAAQAALDAAIAAVNSRIDGLKITDIAGLSDKLDAIDASIDDINGAVSTLQGLVGGVDVVKLAGKVAALETALNDFIKGVAPPSISVLSDDNILNGGEVGFGFSVMGKGYAGAKVTVVFSTGLEKSGYVDDDGNWSIALTRDEAEALNDGAVTFTAVQSFVKTVEGDTPTEVVIGRSQAAASTIAIDRVAPSLAFDFGAGVNPGAVGLDTATSSKGFVLVYAEFGAKVTVTFTKDNFGTGPGDCGEDCWPGDSGEDGWLGDFGRDGPGPSLPPTVITKEVFGLGPNSPVKVWLTQGDLFELGSGQVRVGVEAVDVAGNKSSIGVDDNKLFTFELDTQAPYAPYLSVNAGEDGWTNSSLMYISAEAGSSVLLYKDGAFVGMATPSSSWGNTGTFTFSPTLADGSHTFTAVAVDAAGNKSSPSSISFKLDTVAPVAGMLRFTELTDTGTADYYPITRDNIFKVNLSGQSGYDTLLIEQFVTTKTRVQDPDTKIWSVQTSTTGWTPTVLDTSQITRSGLSDGQYEFRAKLADKAGNVSYSPIIGMIVDRTATAPVFNPVAGDNIINAAERNAGVTISGLAEAGGIVTYTLQKFAQIAWVDVFNSSRTRGTPVIRWRPTAGRSA
jgi:hypothetical protein